MIVPRYYQNDAVNALFSHNYGNGAPLVVIPTGAGKSIVIADFCQKAVAAFPSTRIIIATHSRELVKQNYLELLALWPFAPAGMYSAGLKARDTDSLIVFAGIQSAYDKAYEFQRCDLLLIDEAHTVSRKDETMWGKFIKDLRTINPAMQVIGLSATPYRMDSGSLIEGEGALFKCIAYEYNILQAIADGYLCEVIPKNMATTLNVDGVDKRGGEYVAGQLERAVNVDSVTSAAITELIQYGHDRGTWLMFCSGVAHSHAVAEEIRARGIDCATITGETPIDERDKILADLKARKLRAVTNNNVMTTGTNIPCIDLIGGFRPTGSAGLHVQMLGRGMRTYEMKKNCLYLDFAKNCWRHGPIDRIRPKAPCKGDGDAPVRVCPECNCICFAGMRSCPDCGHAFPEPELKIDKTSHAAPILSTQVEPEWHHIIGVMYDRHEKPGKPPSMKVTYSTLNGTFREWVCFQHTGFAREKAVSWHRMRSAFPVPKTVNEALALPMGYQEPSRICVRPNKDNPKYNDIIRFDFAKENAAPVTTQVADIDFEIPF